MRRRSSSEAGFLLADMLVTLTVSAFVLVGLTGLSALLLRTADRSVDRIEETDDLNRTTTMLASLVALAARARFAGQEPQPFVFNGDAHRLMFARPLREGNGSPALQVLAFRSEDAGMLWRTEARLPLTAGGLGDLPFGPARPSYRGTAHFRFAYQGAGEPNAPSSWVSLWPVGMRMPAAVAIEVLDQTGRRVLARRNVPIMADTDIGCLNSGFCGRSQGREAAASVPDASVTASAMGGRP